MIRPRRQDAPCSSDLAPTALARALLGPIFGATCGLQNRLAADDSSDFDAPDATAVRRVVCDSKQKVRKHNRCKLRVHH